MSAHYWVIANEDLMDMLRRVETGESPDIVAAECYANPSTSSCSLLTLNQPGVDLIAAERTRQVEQEGWSKDHDAEEHDTGELGLAAAAYALEAVRPGRELNRAVWPWDESWWKPKDDPIRNLVRAGALIAAEIDRLQADA